MVQEKQISLENETKESVELLVKHRIPWLFVGLLGGIVLTFVSSKFESLLAANISLAFFIPIIVYMSDAIGTQSQTIYIRDSARRRVRLTTYVIKELFVGTSLGLIFGAILGLFAFFWLKSTPVATSVGLAMFVNMAAAPFVALVVAALLQKEKTDPALGAGPLTTILQDLISLSIYLLIASLIIFR